MEEKEIGVVTHYFGNISVAAIEITDGELCVGDKIHVKGHTSDFIQEVTSMQLEHDSVEKVSKGAQIGIKVTEHVREHDKVYKIVEGP